MKAAFHLPRAWLALAILTAALVLSYTKSPEKASIIELSGYAMTMPYRIVVGASLEIEQQQQVQRIIEESFTEIDTHYNQFNPKSEVSALNRVQAGVPVPLSPNMNSFLHLVDRFVSITEGRFDPTIEPLKKLWLPHLINGTLPSNDELAHIHSVVGWRHVHLVDGVFTKDHDQVQLNLDAIAKGFAVDLLVYNLAQAGYRSVLVEWGGEVKATGKHPEGRPWRVYISGLDNSMPNEALAYLDLEDASLATSGDYFQNWIAGNQAITYCHVFDPHRLQPIEVHPGSVASASVMMSSCAAADALATASMVFNNVEEAQAWANSLQLRYPSLRFWFASRP